MVITSDLEKVFEIGPVFRAEDSKYVEADRTKESFVALTLLSVTPLP
jgi:lysyl-tRNA synthetase class II